jgi:hypothetical protein
MPKPTHDLVIRLDEVAGKLVFFVARKGGPQTAQDGASDFSVEISLEELRERGEVGAERLIGESVLGFFDHLTEGQLPLPRHYRD